MTLGTELNPLRVAIIGSGPAGFYAAEHLLKQELVVEVDMYDRLPTPFGLVRGGVAPDHQKIKTVTKKYDEVAKHPRFRFYGYVEFGTDISLEDLKGFYHQAIFTTGAQTDKRLGIPGEDLLGSHAATEFVAWYNGHPDYRHLSFDLSQERVAVIGVGNVAIDVARILCRTPEELAKTDIADYALEALSQSKVKEVYLIGRRGPVQAAFTTPEVKEIGEMQDAVALVPLDEAELDPLSREELEASGDRALQKKADLIRSYADNDPNSKSRKLYLRFLLSPTEVIGQDGCVAGLLMVKNELYKTDLGTLRPRATDQHETLACGLVFRSIGYQGVPLPDIPFHEKWGVILNNQGRVIDPETQQPIPGLYTAGWIKRGPSGVIGTNKPDSVETVHCMLEDAQQGVSFNPSAPSRDAVEAFLKTRKPQFVSYEGWRKLDALEVANGESLGRPRLKFTAIEEMLAALK